MKLKPREIDQRLERCAALSAEIEKLRAERAALMDDFPLGRTEGERLAVYISNPERKTRYSIKLLREYVTDAVLARCRVVTQAGRRHARIVPKLKPKALRNQEQA